MKKLLFIFLLFPLLVLGQAEKTHRSIIIDSLKAFNGGILDAKDTVNFEKPLKGSVLRFTDDVTGLKTLAELAGDSSFVVLQVDSINAFNNSTIVFDTSLLVLDVVNNRVAINNDVPVSVLDITAIELNDGIVLNNSSGVQHALLGTSAVGGRIRLENNAGTTDIFSVNSVFSSHDFLNTGRRFGINEPSPTAVLDVKALTVNDGIVFKNTSGIQHALLATSASGGRIRLEDNAGSTTIFSINPLSGDDFLKTGNNFGVGTDSPSEKFTVNGNTLIVGRTNYFVDTSSVNDSYGIIESLITAYTTGMNLYVNISVVNTGAATLQINALAAIAIKKLHDQDLVTGDIEVGQIIHVIYDGSFFQMLSQLGQ